MVDFEMYFMPHIWQRGCDIADTDAVSIVTRSKESIKAVVMGTYDYDVYITFLHDDIQMSCTCPFSASGENCKHMAAVLIKTSTKSIPHDLVDYNDLDERFNQLKEKIKMCDRDDLADFFARQLINNDHMKRSFYAKFSSEEDHTKVMVKAFKKIVNYYMGRDGFINYNRAKDFFKELDLFFEELESMLQEGLVMECAEIFTSVMLGFDGLPIDDSAGYTTILYEQLVGLVERILDKDIDEASDLIYSWFEKINEDANSWYLKDMFYDLWSSQYSDQELLDKTIGLLEKELSLVLAEGGPTDNYSLMRCLMTLVKNKEQRNDSKDSILALIKPYEKEAEVTRYLIKVAQEENKEDEEEALILFGIKEAEKKRYHGIVNDFTKMLCEFYKRVGQVEKYQSTLRSLVLESHWSLDAYKEYKSIFDEKTWLEMRGDLITELINKKHNRLLPDVYVEENMLDQLLGWLKNNPELELIKTYSHHLIENYSEEVLGLFLKALDKFASHSGSKSHYNHIVKWMKDIRDLPNGREAIEKKVKEYRDLYKRRTNFIKRLNASF